MKNKKQAALIITGILLFSAAMIIAALTSARVLRKSGYTEAVQSRDAAGGSTVKNEITNFLILGHDSTTGLTDVMMIASFDITDKTVNVVQIPRDTYASYSDGNYSKLNGAFSRLGGAKKLAAFLSEALCVPIDYYISLDLSALTQIVDAVGGVEVNIPCELDYEDPEQNLKIHLPAGRQTLDGKAAEQFVRFRSGYLCGDLGRIDAQKLFLSAFIEKVQSDYSPWTVASLVFKVIDDISTDIPINGIIRYARAALETDMENVRMMTLAGCDAKAHKSGASYYVLSRGRAFEISKTYLSGYAADIHEFDRGRVFLNGNYSEFTAIYYGDYEYEVYRAGEIINSGIGIKTVD